MLAFGVQQVVLHQLVHGIYAAGKGLGKASAAYYRVEVERYSGFFKPFHDEFLAVLILVADVGEFGQFAHVVVCSGHPNGLLVLVDCDFSRRGTWVYH